MSFVHLHSHTHYSLLDGAAKIKNLISEAKKFGMDSLAITDHGNMYGSLEFYTEARKKDIKPIIGCEAYIAPRERSLHRAVEGEPHSYHLVLLAKNETGYRNLIKLTSYSFLQGFYYRPRIDKELLREYSDGLVVLSACMKGEVAYKLRQGKRESAIESAEFYLDLFGDDFYLEIQDHGIEEEHFTYPQVFDLAKEMGIPVVATNDVHYLKKNDSEAHDILLCLQTGKDRDDPNRMRYNTQELYLKSPQEMQALFKDKPDVVERTLEVADKIDLKIDFNQRLLPEFPIPEEAGKVSADEYLEVLARKGIEKKYKKADPKIEKRLDYELKIINKMGFAGYFLIVQDFINAARNKDIPVGLGRGSAAGSIVAYSLGITNVDPLRYDLLFERFLNPERVSMPDIDIDFCVERRDEVIDYVKDKYGRKNVAQIITFGTMAARGVIRDVSRVLKIPIPKADAIAKKIPVFQGKPMHLEDAYKKIPDLREVASDSDPKMKELVEYSQTLEGIARHASVHAAGILIAPDEITNYVPLAITSDKEVTTQWAMGWCEAIGLLKMDFLGLRNLTVIHNTEKMIREKYDENFAIDNIPLDDAKTYELFGRGNTIGIFQFESSGMQEYLRKLQPNRVEDLIAMNALYRPGPMSMIDDFIARKKGKNKIVYAHPMLESILDETYGIIVYQEQVMRITSELGGFSLAEADIMRRIMGKKKKEEMRGQKEKFIEGCINNSIDKKTANEIADMIEKFASYGFNKSHAAAYALIAYQTGYLKSNYTAEFMAANLSSEVNNTDRVVTLIEDCRKMGIEVVPPDINYSEAHFVPLSDNKIAFGMSAIKNVGTGAIQSIIEERVNLGKYKSIFHLMENVDIRLTNKKVLESLAQAGALDSLEGNRAQNFHAIEKAVEFGQEIQLKKKQNLGQNSLFDIHPEIHDKVSYPKLPDVPDWSSQDKLVKEKEFLGFYITGHPLYAFKNIVKLYSTNLNVQNGNQNGEIGIINICGMITEMRTLLDRKQNKMAFVKIEDFEKTYEAVVFGSVFSELEDKLYKDAIVLLNGRLNSELDDPVIKIICEKAIPIDQVPVSMTESLILRVDKSEMTEQKITYLKNTLKSNRGNVPVYFKLKLNGSDEVNMVSKKVKINLNSAIIDELEKILTIENIKVRVKNL
jgi:DNA polymerase III subunit alpha